MELEKMLKKYEERRAALVEQSNKSTDVNELRSLQNQIQAVNEDIEEIRSAIAATKDTTPNAKSNVDERTSAVNGDKNSDNNVEKRTAEPPKFVQGKGFVPAEERDICDYSKVFETREKAGLDLRERRSVISPLPMFGELRTVNIGGGTIVVPKTFSPTINPDFNAISSLVDAVKHIELNGGESFRQPYVTGIDVGGYTAEGANAANAETHFDYVDIIKSKVTAYAELTEELFKLPNAAYADIVLENIRNSMRMLLTKEILVGTGGTNQLVGIFSSQAKAIDANTDIEFEGIDDTTLDEIIYSFGGSEDVEDPAVLILNKADLLEFAKVRTSTTLRYYDIKTNGNTGTINGVPFIINSACNALSKASTAAGAYCMAYGNLSNYSLVEFSPMDVTQSNDYKFAAGMTAYRGNCFFGGNVTRKNGFLRIVKA